MRNVTSWLKVFFMTAIFAVMVACSSGNSDVSPLVDANGKHSANWVAQHWDAYNTSPGVAKTVAKAVAASTAGTVYVSPCTQCHGSNLLDPQSTGGIARVSCFTASWNGQMCHANSDGKLGHPTGWASSPGTQHGRNAAMAKPGVSSGFGYCGLCHGSNYSNGKAISCKVCHTTAPHPPKPWHGTTLSGTNHVFTDPGNAPECAKCHTNGANFGPQLGTPATAGTAPGCFNNTLCHGPNPGHSAGWADPTNHGLAAKTVSSTGSGMNYCRQCHGNDYQGGKVGVSCFGCHTKAPHSVPWIKPLVPARHHLSADPSNAPACGLCHAGGAKSPTVGVAPPNAGCFNTTLCHGYEVQQGHGTYGPSATFLAAAAHGPLAKADLGSCQYCHALPVYGALPRFNVPQNNIPNGCETCHKVLTAHPTPWLPGRTGTPWNVANATTHAGAGNVTTACALCHGTALDGLGGNAPSCMAADPVSGVRCHGASPVAKPTGCTSCHAGPPSGPDGAAAPNRNFGHNKHALKLALDCSACHGGVTSGTANHANGTTDVPLSPTYKANFNATVTSFVYDKPTGSCSGVSCHGGKTTPGWQQANAINVATDCLKCHESGTGTAPGTPQFNSYYSGRHQYHLEGQANDIYKLQHNAVSITCTDCHNLTTLATQHFLGLDTPGYGMNDAPANTVGSGATKITNYDKVQHTCSVSCHVGGEGSWF